MISNISAASLLEAGLPDLSTTRKLDDATDYPRFDAAMKKYGYDWKAYNVTTEDGYKLTTFRILGKTGKPAADKKASILMQHGASLDAASWVMPLLWGENKPYHLELVDAGYDVWMGNNRGTEYSQGHQTLTAQDNDYWKFSWAEMGLYDDVANAKLIKKTADVDKIIYIGYSQGSIQMHYSLANLEDTFWEDILYNVISLAPCFAGYTADVLNKNYDNAIDKFQSKGVYAINGPNWRTTDIKGICSFGKEVCDYYKLVDGAQGQSVQSDQHHIQCSTLGRFQEYAPEWGKGKRETDLVPIENITETPMTFFVANNDVTCKPKQALDHIAKIPSKTKTIQLPEKTHEYFFYEAFDEAFVSQLLAEVADYDDDHAKQFLLSTLVSVSVLISMIN